MSEPQETHMEDYFSTLGPKPRPEHGPKIAPDDCKADVPCPNAAALPAEPCVDATQPEQPSAPPRKAANKNVACHSLKEYFPVRRSARKTRNTLKKERRQRLEDAILNGDEEGFQVVEFADKGRGVTTTRPLREGDFVLEYAGELLDMKEARRREQLYAQDQSVGCYMYYFTCKDKHYCVDATVETGRLGRLVNHSKRDGNLRSQACLVGDTPHLVLLAQRDIQPGEELLYDYGDRSRASLQCHPWLAL